MRDALGTGDKMYVRWEGKGNILGGGLSIGSGVTFFCCCVGWMRVSYVGSSKK